MTVAPRMSMTLAEFLAWEERQEPRVELDGFQPVTMTGGTDVREGIGGALRGVLRGKPGHIRYPDAFACGTPVPPPETAIKDPVVVFELPSPGISGTDRIEGRREYQAKSSIQRNIILEQDSVAAMMFAQWAADWDARALTAVDVQHMPKFGVTLPLAAIYAGVDGPASNPEDPEAR